MEVGVVISRTFAVRSHFQRHAALFAAELVPFFGRSGTVLVGRMRIRRLCCGHESVLLESTEAQVLKEQLPCLPAVGCRLDPLFAVESQSLSYVECV